MKRELEALLFATDSPLTLARLKKIFPEAETTELRDAVAALQAEYDEHDHAFTVIEFGGGFQIATKPEFSPIVEKMLKTRRFTRLSKAGLEVLAIIAYKQPLTRIEIDDIRGVNSAGAISTLTERNLITVVGRSQAVGNPLLYGTTREFLNHLGLKGLGQLPDLPDLEHVMDDRDELKEFASRVGRDVSDEELEDYFAAPEEGEADPLEESAETETDGDAGPDAESRADDEEPVAADAADAAPECEPADDADEQPARRESAE
ncbi:SMC-Scp complex subunit ScpB [bacterium]|nr:SMC-Scp complex subunit ScpB [bacterium]